MGISYTVKLPSLELSYSLEDLSYGNLSSKTYNPYRLRPRKYHGFTYDLLQIHYPLGIPNEGGAASGLYTILKVTISKSLSQSP